MREYFLTTNRIAFSRWTSADYDLAYLLWSEESVSRYISKTGRFSDQEIQDRLNLEINNECQFHVQYWPIFERATDELIGCCGLRPYNGDMNIYEIGFHLRSQYWGKGLGSEAAKAVIVYAYKHLNADELFAGHNPNNESSKRVLVKLGFQYIGDEFYTPTGLYHPSYRFSLR